MIIEQVAFHLAEFVSLHKRYKLLLARLNDNRQTPIDSESAALAVAELGCAENSLVQLFAHFGPEVEEFLQRVKDCDFPAAYAQNFLLLSKPALPVSLRWNAHTCFPGTVFAAGDERGEALFSRQILMFQDSIQKNLAAAEKLLPESAERLAAIAAERTAVRKRGVRTFLGAAGTDWCPGLAFID